MRYQLHDTVALARDMYVENLKAGDLGAIVEIYESDGLEIEFVTSSGQTKALVTLTMEDVRFIPGSQ